MSLRPAGAPAGRQSVHWLAKRGLQPHAPPPDPGGGRPSYPLGRLRRLLLLPAVPLPLLPSSSSPRFVSVVSRAGRRGGWSWRFLSTRPGLGPAPGEVGRTRAGVRSPPCPPEPLSKILFSDSLFQHCPPHLCLFPQPLWAQLGSPLGGPSRVQGATLSRSRAPSAASLCHHLSQPVLPALCPRA